MKKLTIEKVFNASMEKIWEAFTTPEILRKWWSPEGMDSSHISVNLEVGGIFRYCFKGSDGAEFWGRGVYQGITKPKYLSYLDTFSDAAGHPVPSSHYGIPGDEIVETLIEIALTGEGNTTRMMISMDNYYDDSMTESLTKGWEGMFDKLAHLYYE